MLSKFWDVTTARVLSTALIFILVLLFYVVALGSWLGPIVTGGGGGGATAAGENPYLFEAVAGDVGSVAFADCMTAYRPLAGVRIVDLYADNHFQQIKVYTQLKPDVLRAIAAEAETPETNFILFTGFTPIASVFVAPSPPETPFSPPRLDLFCGPATQRNGAACRLWG